MTLPDGPPQDADVRASPWPVVIVSVVLLAMGAFLLFERAPEPTPPPVPAPAPERSATIALPDQPIIAVLGFADPDGDPEDPRAAVVADLVRVALEHLPAERGQVVPLSTLEARFPAQTAIDDRLSPEGLVRADRGPGHVDMAIRGVLEQEGEHLKLMVQAIRPTDLEVIDQWVLTGSDDLLMTASLVAMTLADAVGAKLPTAQPSKSLDAYAAYLQARQARRVGEQGPFENSLKWALKLEPDLVPARLLELEWLSTTDQGPVLAERAAALLKRTDLSARARGLAEAWQALSGSDAVQVVEARIEARPHDIEPYRILQAVHAKSDARAEVTGRIKALTD